MSNLVLNALFTELSNMSSIKVSNPIDNLEMYEYTRVRVQETKKIIAITA